MVIFNRYYNSLLGDSYEGKGARLYDSLEIFPAAGRKKEIALNRKSFILNSSLGDEFKVLGSDVQLPSLMGERFCYELKLCPPIKGKDMDDSKMRYLLVSKTNTPFRLNHNLVFEAFIERGDQVFIGYNKLNFNYKKIKKTLDCNYQVELNDKMIKSDLVISIEGETGTGKSTLAKRIHSASERLGEFVQINISSFSESLVESELFGHSKGAFTGAIQNKLGAFEKANRGTLFIDEIDSLSKEIQTKLLLFLDNKKIQPVGGHADKKLDVRLIVASGTELSQLVDSGKMRRDFYFRISSGFNIKLSPLRKNKKLIHHLVNKFEEENEILIDSELIEFYESLDWPGNIRQFYGHLNKKMILTKGRKLKLNQEDELLRGENLILDEASEKILNMKNLKKEYAYKMMLKFNGNMKCTSKALGITPKTLRNLIAN